MMSRSLKEAVARLIVTKEAVVPLLLSLCRPPHAAAPSCGPCHLRGVSLRHMAQRENLCAESAHWGKSCHGCST